MTGHDGRAGAYVQAQLVGQSPAFRTVLDGLTRAALVTAPVLIHGRTGTGKELVARAIHYSGERRVRALVPVNCGGIPDGIFESELFGHVRGAFTDARTDREGLVARAAGGTLFLDEVDALSPKGQVALLRFLQDLEYRPVGASASTRSDARIIAASNADLAEAVERRTFREDLFFRLTVLSIAVPTLAEREGDVALLAAHFLPRISRRYRLPEKRLSGGTLRAMEAYDWPGNVRELENFLHNACVMTDGDLITQKPTRRLALGSRSRPVLDAEPFEPAAGFHAAKAAAIARFERSYLAQVIKEAGGNVTRAAEIAGTERRTLGKLLKRHGLGG
jgi:two-component system, NtrC family, response regulator GlrR